jgi:hypothetical protein
MSEEIKSAIVFVCAVTPNPVVEISDAATVKTRQGLWLPAIMGKSILADGREYVTKFPVFCMDAMNAEQLEEVRKLLHERVDAAINEHKTRWEEMSKEEPNHGNVRTIRDALKTAKEKEEQGSAPQ